MPDPTAQRTLVKSPPELWAEVSDAGALAKHLGEFGEIRITRLEPETTVAWEGDRASGTVKLEPSGWGTKVTLTAVAVEAEEPVAAEPEAVVVAEPAPAPEPAPVVVAEPEPEPEPAPEPTAAIEEEPEERSWLDRHPPEEPGPKKLGFWARLFGRRREPEPEPVAEVLPGPEPTPLPDPAPIPEPPAPDPVPPTPTPDPTPPAPDPTPPTAPDPTPPPEIAAVLTNALDNLGSAHHRPFSRG